MEEEYVDSMILGAGHCLMVPNIPQGVNLQMLADNFYDNSKVGNTISSFGLFGTNIDYNTFYPGVTSKDFNPETDDYIEPTFRMISAAIVAKQWAPTDFSKPGILKSAMSLLLGQTVNCDHETGVGNAIGSVSQVAWQNQYTDKVTGVTIPAGINAVLRIDAKSNPRIARGINMDPPSIHSNSVTVQFGWEPSHTFEKEWEFMQALGTTHKDGTMVRRMVTRIISFKETSLVSHGADPFAQIIKDGKIINPTYAGAQYYSFSEDKQKELAKELKSKMSYVDFKSFSEESIMHNTGEFNNKDINLNNKNKHMDKEFEQFLTSLKEAGILSLEEGTEATTERVLTQLKMLATSKQEAEDLTIKLSEVEAAKKIVDEEVISLKAVIKQSEKMSTIGTERLLEVRGNTLSSYKKLYGEEKTDPNIIALISSENTGLETLNSLNKSYEISLEEKFPVQCASCGSKDVSRASSKSEPEEDTTKLAEGNLIDTIARLAESKR